MVREVKLTETNSADALLLTIFLDTDGRNPSVQQVFPKALAERIKTLLDREQIISPHAQHTLEFAVRLTLPVDESLTPKQIRKLYLDIPLDQVRVMGEDSLPLTRGGNPEYETMNVEAI